MDELTILDAINVRSQSECEQTVNPEFWKKTVDVVFGIMEVILPIIIQSNGGGGIDLSDLEDLFDFDDLADDIKDLIGTPYFSANFCDSDISTSESISGGNYEVEIYPNDPVHLIIYSSSNILAGGKRSWHSWGRVRSDFYIGAVKLADKNDGICCTEKQGSWIYASVPDYPISRNALKGALGYIFGIWQPWPYPLQWGGGIDLPYQYGSMVHDIGACSGEGGGTIAQPDEPIDDGGGNNGSDFRSVNFSNQCKIYDLTGRLVLSLKVDTRKNTTFLIEGLKGKLTSGMYIIVKGEGANATKEKVFISN